MKLAEIVRGGALGGVIVAGMLTAAGELLDVNVAPWSWSAVTSGFVGRAMEWAWTAGVLTPIGCVFAVGAAGVCALTFEYVTQRAGWLPGAFVGLLLGVAAAGAVGLVPWLASQFYLTYAPPAAPLGPHDASWTLAALVAAGIVSGAIAGACYGPPLHASQMPAALKWREIYPTTRRLL